MMEAISCPAGHKDVIRINDLVFPVLVSNGAQWPALANKAVEQMVSITLSVCHDISQTAMTEDVKYTINYASLADEIRAAALQRQFHCIQDLSRHICDSFYAFSSLKNGLDGLQVRIKVTQPKAFLHSQAVALQYLGKFSTNDSWSPHEVTHLVEDFVFSTIIGIEPCEREVEQSVVCNIAINTGERGLDPQDWVNMREIMQSLWRKISTSNYLTLEALTSAIASQILTSDALSEFSPIVSIGVAKPSALPLARSAEVQIVRTLSDHSSKVTHEALLEAQESMQVEQGTKLSKVAIALGSNLGDSFQNIEYALRLLEIPEEILGDDGAGKFVSVVDTSFLYETAPMYVTDQPSFINCACVVETDISPIILLRLLKKIENIVGRVPSLKNGPRAVDLDIVFYGDVIFDTRTDRTNLDDLDGELVIPHPRVEEREFVLRPLADMIPDYVHPVLKKSVEILLTEVYDPTAPGMNKVIPFPRLPVTATRLSSAHPLQVPETLTHWVYPSSNLSFPSRKGKGGKTHIMATLNVTPDSFSDGAMHDALPAALAYASTSVAQGATIIDVGGYSTRPGAAFVSVADEIARVVPAVAALRDASTVQSAGDCKDPGALSTRVRETPISVDTFRWEVAEAALAAGANCINDVYAFAGPDAWPAAVAGSARANTVAEYTTKMKAVARAHGVPVVLMHSRGDAGANKDYSAYQYALQSTVEGVRVELGARVNDIVRGRGGVRRWLVIVDPGIGFSKTVEGNLEVLRSAQDVVADVRIGDPSDNLATRRNPLRGYLQLIGVSRKSFLGSILAQDPNGRQTAPKERSWATAAAVTCAVQQKAAVVRVHDVKEMADVVRVAEALWL
ncbi:hypothetical protein HYPSUDRAFT_64899 [Hypholoma sublateritium FD-334 SS-4]|uniref:2-amino-4-hydroxy-6-hydroxymethyldihydropteridine diphosphokinase n=1 Tax=Hypholoma sublateritium (strain FD-334 SS-4) TaxID=945553 RepID=A0A0D2P321_HYPSF|nr:hypothetical protein HYPSUDRAFT_64899 [Hypholoma sublateritium FD-334 SS-4]